MTTVSTFRFLVVLSLLFSLANALHFARYFEPSAAYLLIQWFTWGIGVVWWIRADIQTSRYWPGQSFNMFLFFGWPICVPYYWIAAHGRKSVVPLFKFFVLVLLPYLVYVFTYFGALWWYGFTQSPE